MDDKTAVRSHLGRILHATGLSQDEAVAFAHSLKLALAARGEFCIVHTDRDKARAGAEWDAFPGVRATLARWGLLPADAPSPVVAELLGLRVRKVDIPAREPVQGVMGLVDKHPFDLVVMASQARDGVARWLHPSIAEPLAREARLPALFLPHGTRGFIDPVDGAVRLRNVLIPVDLSPHPAQAVALAMELADLLDAGDAVFHLLHVGVSWPDTPLPADMESRVRMRQSHGPVVSEIITVADELDADLIVMATHGHDGLLDALRGSTTEQVLRRAGRALLAVPAG